MVKPPQAEALLTARSMSQYSPLRLLLIVGATVFLIEALVMMLFFAVVPTPGLFAAFLDALLLVILIAPALYLFLLKPMRTSIAERLRAEAKLAHRNRALAALNAVSRTPSNVVELRQILASLKELLSLDSGFPAGTICTYDKSSDELQVELTWGVEKDVPAPGTRVPVQSCAFRELLRDHQIRALARKQVDGSEDDRFLASLLSGSNGCVGIPLGAFGEIHGLMVLTKDKSVRIDDPEHFRYLQAIGQIMGLAANNTRLFERERDARQTTEVLRQAGVALTQSLDMATVMDAVLDFTGRLVPYDSASIILVEDQDHLAIHAARGCDCIERLKANGSISLGREKGTSLEQVLADRRGRILNDLPPDQALALSPCNRSMRSWLGVPFVAGENVIGLIGVGKKEAGFYSSEHLQLAEALASQAAVAVQNAWLFAQLRSGRERLQTLSRQLVEVQENERAYIARELHDEAGQVLTSLMVGLRLLERDAHNTEATVAGIARLKGMVENVLNDLHRLAMDLRPASLDYLGLDAALRQHLETIAEHNQITAQIETVGMDVRLPKDIEVALYRIVQEALANVIRHARATRVDVFLERRADRVMTIVEDNGIGFNEELALNSGRLGLLGMRERAEMLGGSLTIECARSGGTTLLVEVPYGDSDSDSR